MTKTKKIIIALIALATLGAIIAVLCCIPAIQQAINSGKVDFAAYVEGSHGDRIHFMNTASSDAILIESDGKYGMVDCGEDTDNPRNFPGLELQGHEEKVVEYVKKIAGDEDGKVTLEFVVGTHSHSDHIGGFDTLISDPDITVKKAYIREYDESKILDHEVNDWDNREVYIQMVEACEARGVEIIHDLKDVKMKHGNFNISILNGDKDVSEEKKGENENSVGILVEKAGMRAFLAGDINNYDNDEDRLGDIIGDVDILKAGHHGYGGSSSAGFVKKLKPEVAILTNTIYGLDAGVRMNLNAVGASIQATVEHNGIIAEFGESEIKYLEDIH